MKPFITISFFTLIMCSWSAAQAVEQGNISIFYLKNGSVYIGQVESEERALFRVHLLDGNQVNVHKHEIKRILDSHKIKVYQDGKYQLRKGYFFHTSIGFNSANIFESDEGSVSSHLTLSYGFQFNPKFALSAGIAFEFNEAEVSGFAFDTQFTPIFIHGRYFIMDSKSKPFVFGRIGYGFADESDSFTNDHQGGIQYQLGAGIQFPSRKRGRWTLSLGYHVQKTNGMESFVDLLGNEISTEYDIRIRRWILKVGIDIISAKKYR